MSFIERSHEVDLTSSAAVKAMMRFRERFGTGRSPLCASQGDLGRDGSLRSFLPASALLALSLLFMPRREKAVLVTGGRPLAGEQGGRQHQRGSKTAKQQTAAQPRIRLIRDRGYSSEEPLQRLSPPHRLHSALFLL